MFLLCVVHIGNVIRGQLGIIALKCESLACSRIRCSVQ